MCVPDTHTHTCTELSLSSDTQQLVAWGRPTRGPLWRPSPQGPALEAPSGRLPRGPALEAPSGRLPRDPLWRPLVAVSPGARSGGP